LRIEIPTGARLQNIEAFAKKVSASEDPSLELAIPSSYFSVHPMVLAGIGAAALRAKKRGATVSVSNVPETQGTRYLERMGLFKLLGVDSGFSVASREEAGRFIPLQVIRSGQQLSGFIQNLAPLLHAEDHSQAEPIQYVMSELVRNTIEHAGFAEPAVVAAQVFPKTGVVAIGVADCGSGISTSLRLSHPITDDLNGVQTAMRPGVTGKTNRIGGTGDNAGAGLFFCKSMALTSGNHMVVYSGTGLYKLLKAKTDEGRRILHANPEHDHATRRSEMPAWPGTLVGIDISVNTFMEFNAILSFIRDAYNVDVRSQKGAKKKKRATFV
jgi:anti-sigma regulatory factor (Ser/Thr protein kinase)